MNYKIDFHDFKNETIGKYSINSPTSGFLEEIRVFVIKGWFLPTKEDQFKLEYQIIAKGKTLYNEEIIFMNSPTVAKKFPKNKFSTKSRLLVRVKLGPYLKKHKEIVVRVLYTKSGGSAKKVFDYSFISDPISVKPIFILGSPRSGTTALGNAVRSTLKAKSYGEHHIQEVFKNSLDGLLNKFNNSLATNVLGTFIHDVSPALISANLQLTFKQLVQDYHPGNYFVDKTPGIASLRAIETTSQMWPNAKFIYIKRRPLENIASRLKKFPNVSFEAHCIQWAEINKIWRSLKKQPFLKDKTLTVDQYQFLFEPEIVSKTIVDFLELSSPEEHRAFIENYLKNESPQKTGNKIEILDFKEINWTKEQKRLFLDKCGEELKIENYSLDKSYYKKTAISIPVHK